MRLFFATLLACFPGLANATATIFGAAPAVDHVRISPSGTRVLAVASDGSKRSLAVIDLSDGTITIALEVKERTELLDSCEWATNERIVCALYVFPRVHGEGGRLPYPRRRLVRLAAVDHDGGNPLALLNRPPPKPVKMGGHIPLPRIPYDDLEHVLLHPLPDDPEHVLVAAPREATPYKSVYRVHVGNGGATRIIGWQAGIVFWHADREGRVRVGTGWYEFNSPRIPEPGRGPTAMAVDAEGQLQRLDVAEISGRIGTRELAGPRILGFSTDEAQLYYEARVSGADRAAVWVADAATLKPLRPIVSHPQRDVYAEAIAGRDCGVVGFMHPLPGRPFTWLDADFGNAVEAAGRMGEGDLVAVTSMSSDCRWVVLAATDGLTRRAFYLLDITTGALRRLGDQYPAAAEAQPSQSQRRAVRYATRDGLDLPMTLTTPTGEELAPIVVLLDGSPGRRSTAALDTWPHFFASRGYVVAEPAFRGARGYGTTFHVTGLQARGAKLQDDVSDAVAWLGEAGLGDASRVCFIGRGRGGHFAVAAALADTRAQTRAANRCAAAYAAMDIALTKRAEHNPFDGRLCNFFPCGDWMRWANPSQMRHFSGPVPADERRKLNNSEPSLLRSPLVDAEHPGFPVLIHADGRSVVHEKGSRRFRADLKELGFFEQVAPVGSDDEAAFLAAAESLFSEVLHGSEATP